MLVKNGDTVIEYTLEIYVTGKAKKNKEPHNVIAVREHEKRGTVIVIEDDYSGYEVLETKHDKYSINKPFNKAIVFERKWNSKYSDDYIYACITVSETNENKVYKKLKKEIEKFLIKEYGRYGNYIELLEKIEI